MILELRRKKFDVIISLRPTSLWLNIAITFSGVKTRIGFENPISLLSNTITKFYKRDIYIESYCF